MTNEQFLSTSKIECLQAAVQCHDSATAHYNVAKSAAALGHFGIANSLLILSVEECVKAMLFGARFFNVELPFDVAPYFKIHAAKHKQAAEIQPLLNKIWHAKDLFNSILKNRKSDYETHSRITINGALLLIMTKVIELIIGPGEDFATWWSDANNQKNNGFYVGYNEGKWNFPSDFTESTYHKTMEVAKPFIESLEIVHSIQETDHLLFSKDKSFTQEEIETSGYKIFLSEDDNSQNVPK